MSVTWGVIVGFLLLLFKMRLSWWNIESSAQNYGSAFPCKDTQLEKPNELFSQLFCAEAYPLPDCKDPDSKRNIQQLKGPILDVHIWINNLAQGKPDSPKCHYFAQKARSGWKHGHFQEGKNFIGKEECSAWTIPTWKWKSIRFNEDPWEDNCDINDQMMMKNFGNLMSSPSQSPADQSQILCPVWCVFHIFSLTNFCWLKNLERNIRMRSVWAARD